jgi:hypothetical protein
LKSEGKNFSQEAFIELLNQVNKNRSLVIDLHKQVASEKQKLESLMQHMNLSETHIDADMEKLLLELMDTFTLRKSESKEAYEALYDYMESSNAELVEELKEYLNTKSNMSTRKKEQYNTFIITMATFRQHKKTGIHTKEDVTFVYKQQFLHNVAKQVLQDFPSIILNDVDYTNVSIATHWNLTRQHNKDIQHIVKATYEPLVTNYKNETLKPLVKTVLERNNMLMSMLDNIPFMYSHVNGESVEESLFDHALVESMYTFIVLHSFKLYIDILETDLQSDMLELDGEMTDLVLEAMDATDTSVRREQLANMLYDYCDILDMQKKLINVNRHDIMEKLLVIRDTEKDRITRYLKDLTEEERQVDTAFKHMKLGRWSKGMQKGLTQYVKETYDEERAQAEQEALIDLQLNANMNVTDMNRDVYRFDKLEKQMAEQEMEREAYDMGVLPDDDEYGEGMDGDEFNGGGLVYTD